MEGGQNLEMKSTLHECHHGFFGGGGAIRLTMNILSSSIADHLVLDSVYASAHQLETSMESLGLKLLTLFTEEVLQHCKNAQSVLVSVCSSSVLFPFPLSLECKPRKVHHHLKTHGVTLFSLTRVFSVVL